MFEALIWVIPASVFLLGIWNPRAGLLLFVSTLPLFGSPPGGPYLAALDVACVGAIITSWRGGNGKSPLTFPLSLFVIVSLLTLVPLAYLPPSWAPTVLLGLLKALPGVESSTALFTWRAAIDLCLGFGLFLGVTRAFERRALAPLGHAVLTGLCATLILGLVAFVGILDLQGFRPLRTENIAYRRLASLFFLSGWFSQYVVIAAPIALAALLKLKKTALWVVPFFSALVCVSLFLTKQRGAWLAMAAQLAVWLIVVVNKGVAKKTISKLVTTSMAAVALVSVLVAISDLPLASFSRRFQTLDSGFENRVMLWQAAVEMIADKPLLGSGLGSFSPAYDVLHPADSPDVLKNHETAHNLYMHVAAERGFLGLLALAAVGVYLARCIHRWRPQERNMMMAIATSLVGVAVYGLVQYPFYIRNLGWLLWVLIAMAGSASRLKPTSLSKKKVMMICLPLFLALAARVFGTEAQALGGSHTYGFHKPESTQGGYFRWTEGVAALVIPEGCPILIMAIANGHPLARQRPVHVTVRIDNSLVAQWKLYDGWVQNRIRVPRSNRGPQVLLIEANPTFRPFSNFRNYSQLGKSTDIRLLGVAMRELRCEAAIESEES